MARLRYGIGPIDFLMYGLDSQPRARWGEYVTENSFRALAREVNTSAGRLTADDKLLFFEHCRRHGLATVAPLGVIRGRTFEPASHEYGSVTILDEAQLGEALAASGELFLKRIRGGYGEGAVRARWVNGGVCFNGRTGTLHDLFAACAQTDGPGYIAQPVLRMHSAMQQIMSVGLGTARVVTCSAEGAQSVIGACLRITVGDNITDNFVHGSSGNLVAGIDPATGTLFSCFGAAGDGSSRMVPVERHPDTLCPVVGFVLPGWSGALDLVSSAHSSLPGLRLVGWDIAFTRDGAVLLEANARPGLQGLQVALGRGIGPALVAARCRSTERVQA